MKEIKIKFAKKTINLKHPECFNELAPEQFKAVLQYVFMSDTPIHERIGEQIILMQHMLQRPMSAIYKCENYRIFKALLDECLISDVLKLQDFVYAEQIFNNWILDKIVVENKTFTGPRNRFSYMKFGQFAAADMYFLAWTGSKSQEVMHQFIACLYTNKPDFTTDDLEQRANQLSKLSKIEKQCIAFNYSYVRDWMTTRYPYVFKGNEQTLGYDQMNFHNQYIQYFAELGVVGFILICLMVFANFKNALFKQDFLHFCFALMILALFLTESFLWRQRGVMFFIMFYCLMNTVDGKMILKTDNKSLKQSL
jgi:hypothetical protein